MVSELCHGGISRHIQYAENLLGIYLWLIQAQLHDNKVHCVFYADGNCVFMSFSCLTVWFQITVTFILLAMWMIISEVHLSCLNFHPPPSPLVWADVTNRNGSLLMWVVTSAQLITSKSLNFITNIGTFDKAIWKKLLLCLFFT